MMTWSCAGLLQPVRPWMPFVLRTHSASAVAVEDLGAFGIERSVGALTHVTHALELPAKKVAGSREIRAVLPRHDACHARASLTLRSRGYNCDALFTKLHSACLALFLEGHAPLDRVEPRRRR